MRALPMMLAGAALTLSSCQRQEAQNQAANEDMSVESNLAGGQLPPNAQIETLPPDESSGSSGELNSGEDNPDVNDLSNAH